MENKKFKELEPSLFGKLFEDLIICEVNERLQSEEQRAIMKMYDEYHLDLKDFLSEDSKRKFMDGLRDKIKSDVMMEIINRIFPEGKKHILDSRSKLKI